VRRLETLGLQLEESLNYGIFGAISGLLLDVIRFFYKISHSWGIAIILLAVALNLLLFPLTNKSFKSMQKMQALQPEMEALKAKHKDNPQKMNKEVMELYKKYNINPFSGCLPLLLQMPIFIALYNALVRFVEFKNARFLWIKDLSLPDALRLPATLPVVGNSINILPILMAISMIVQQKLSSASAGAVKTAEQKQQQNMMLMMSVVFGFIFYNLPSGLVLYWFMNTLMTIIEQLLLKRRLA
jgi:YidC/Oxa1 family membrane protein insertase